MKAFRVWVRPLGGVCRVRVDGLPNATWLLDRLGQSFVFKTCEPICCDGGSSCCTFRVSYGPQVSRSSFDRILAAIPEVNLMTEPE